MPVRFGTLGSSLSERLRLKKRCNRNGSALHPSSADIALLRAALSEGEVARAAYGACREQLDWDSIPAKWQRLIPLLHHNVTTLGIQDPLVRRFRRIRRYLWARNLGLMDLAKRVHVAFAEVNVPVLALKGTSLVAGGYLDRSIRPMEDIDILVTRSHFEAAIKVLKGLGFEPHGIRPRCLVERVVPMGELPLPGWPFRNAEGNEVDLHWNALHLDRRPEADSDAWHRSRRVMFEGISILVLDPTDQLLHICAHGIQTDGPDTIGWIADAICVIRGARLDWEDFLRRSAYHRLSASLADALASLSNIVSLPIPNGLLRRLRQQSSFEERIESKLRRHGQAASYLERAALSAALYRRGRPELFDGTLFATVRASMKSAMGTRTFIEALGRYLYWRLGHPRALRKLLAPDRAISLPPSSQLPLLDGAVDVTADEAPESLFIHGWSISERVGRWTDGPFAILALRLAEPANVQTRIRIFGIPAISSDHKQIPISVFLADNRVAFCKYDLEKTPPACIAFGIPEHLRSQGAIVMLTLEIRKPMIQSRDVRALGLLLQRIEISDSDGALISASSPHDTSLLPD